MICPRCNSAEVESHGQRYALYPSGLVMIIGLPFALLQQLSSPREYHCTKCSLDFARRTTVGKAAGIVLLLLIAGFVGLVVLLGAIFLMGIIS